MTFIALVNEIYFNVKQYGAFGDGATDDTAAIATAVTAASVAGGTLYFPPGTYITGTQSLNSSVHWLGAGYDATILLLKAGTNADLLHGSINGYGGTLVNIAAAATTGSNSGVTGWSVKSMTLDGNGANQTGGPSCCIRVYGMDYTLMDIVLRNGYTNNLYSDWNGTAPATAENMEARLVNVRSHNTYNGTGIKFAGPHDSQFVNVLSYRASITTGGHAFHIGPNTGGLQATNCHGYSPGTGISACSWLIEGASTYYYNCVAEGSDTMQVAVLANKCHWDGSIFSPTASPNGLQIGQQAALTPFFESVNQSAGVTTAVAANGTIVKGMFNGLTGTNGAIWFANSGGNSHVEVVCEQASGSCLTGSFLANDQVWVQQHGLTPDGTFAKGGGVQIGLTASKAFTLVDASGGAVLNVNSYTGSKKVELSNGTLLRQYSDGFTTRTVELSGGTISLLQSLTAAVTATSGTITTSGVGVARIAPAGAITAVILQAGTLPGQECEVINESAFSVTFDVVGTSHVADGVSAVILANRKMHFRWDGGTSLWYHS